MHLLRFSTQASPFILVALERTSWFWFPGSWVALCQKPCNWPLEGRPRCQLLICMYQIAQEPDFCASQPLCSFTSSKTTAPWQAVITLRSEPCYFGKESGTLRSDPDSINSGCILRYAAHPFTGLLWNSNEMPETQRFSALCMKIT